MNFHLHRMIYLNNLTAFREEKKTVPALNTTQTVSVDSDIWGETSNKMSIFELFFVYGVPVIEVGGHHEANSTRSYFLISPYSV